MVSAAAIAVIVMMMVVLVFICHRVRDDDVFVLMHFFI